MAKGPGRYHPETGNLIDTAVDANQCVIYGKFDGYEIVYNGRQHQLIRDDDVLLTYPKGGEATFENVKCVKDQVMIELPQEKTETESGIGLEKKQYAPGQKSGVGVVAKVGPGRTAGNAEMMKMQVKPGDNCRFREFAGTTVKLDGKIYNVIRSYDILSVW